MWKIACISFVDKNLRAIKTNHGIALQIISILLLILICTILIHSNLECQTPKSRILGVVMGISKYQNVPSLKYADRDAMSFYNFLLSPVGGSADTNNIRLLLNEKATSYNFFEAMDNLLDMAKEGDQVYIYFAGHGDIEKKTDRQNGFLIGYNAPPNCYAAGGCISVKFLQDYVETLVANKKARVTVIIDACRSGKLAGGSQGNEITALALQAEWKGVTKILSCQPGETSLEGEQWGGGAGVFTYFMLKGMLGQADKDGDEKVSVMELNNYLDENVLKETNKKQLPTIIGDRRQDIVKVDKTHALAMLNQMERPISLPLEKQSAGFEADVSSIKDISVLKEYEKFKYYINNNNLIAYNVADKDKETALSIYRSLENSRESKSIIIKMKRELIAALQNKTQTILNSWIESSSINDEQFKSDSYQELNTAFSLADTSDPQYYQIKYRYLFFKSQYEKDSLKAIKLLEECININPDESFAFLGIGTIYFNKFRNYEKALSYFDKALELSNNSPLAWTDRGNALSGLGKNEEAITCFDKAIKINSRDYVAWVNKGNALNILGKPEEALKCSDKAIEINPNRSAAWSKKSVSYIKLGRYDEAMKCIDKEFEINPNSDDAWFNKGNVSYFLGKPDEAIKCLDKAIELNPSNFNAVFNKSVYLINTQRYEEAVKFLDKVLEIDPNNELALVNKGVMYINLKNNEEAIKCFDKVLEINPQNIEAWKNKGISLRQIGKNEEAIKCYDKALEINPNEYNVLYSKGLAYEYLKNYEEAIKCYDKALEIKPDEYNVLYSKGFAYGYSKNYEEAIKCYDKAIELKPDDFCGYDGKGYYLFKMGKHEEGMKAIDKALEINPAYANAWYNKACCNGIIKNKPEMLKYLKKAIELDKTYKADAPNDEDFKEYWNDPDFMELVK